MTTFAFYILESAGVSEGGALLEKETCRQPLKSVPGLNFHVNC